MILALAVILGLIASLIRHRGRAVEQITSVPLHLPWLALLAVILQYPLLRTPTGSTQQVVVQQVLFLLSHAVLLLFVWQNRHLLGIRLIGVGVICNLLVILANGGFMPITPETLVRINPGSIADEWPAGIHYGHSKDIILPRHETTLWPLSDILVFPPPFPWPVAFSLGDLLLTAGIVVLLQGDYLAAREGANAGRTQNLSPANGADASNQSTIPGSHCIQSSSASPISRDQQEGY
jgi:hypothetical protein